MSAPARERVRAWRGTLEKPQYQVAMAVAYYADRECRNAYPSKKLIAEDTGLSERQVQRILKRLEFLEVLTVESGSNKKGGRGKSTIYRINPFPGDPQKGDIQRHGFTS